MGGGGSSTTNNTYTGLGDDQYTNLKAGQTSLGTQISDVNTAAQERFNAADTALQGLATGQTNLGGQITDTQNQIASGFQAAEGVNAAFQDPNEAIYQAARDDAKSNAIGTFRTISGLEDSGLTYDANGDGKVDISDGISYLRQSTGLEDVNVNLTDSQQASKDFYDNTGGNIYSGMSRIDTGVADARQDIAGVNQNVTGVGEAVNTGFANVDARFGDMSNQITTGFDTANTNMETGFTNTQNAIGTAAEGINTNIADARADINQNVNSGFEATQNQLTDAQKAIIAGQGGLGEQLTQVGGNLDTYYAGLAAQNAEALANQGQLQTGLNDYINQYTKDNKLAVQQRADLVQGVTSGLDAVNENMASQADAASAERMALGKQVAGVGTSLGDAVSESAQQTETNFSDVAKQIAVGFDDGTQQSQDNRMDFINRLNTVRDVLATQGDNLDANIRDQYTKMSSSFDENGELISRSLDQQGNTIGRALDSQGNLLLATFDQYGGRIDQQSLNLNQMMSQLDMLGYVPTSGASSGSVAPQFLNTRPAAVQSGLASPFTSTR